MASKQAAKRLGKEYQTMQKCPPPFVIARPSESNILEWHCILRGPPDTEYVGGEYYAMVVFPPEYPFKPPSLKMITPSGRFQPNAAICTSVSSFHPGSWNPGWSCGTILTGLLSFMVADEITTGSIRTTAADKKALAATSHAWNITNAKFRTIFPDHAGPTMKDLPDMGHGINATSTEESAAASSSSTVLPTPPTSVIPPSSDKASSIPSSGIIGPPPPTLSDRLRTAKKIAGWSVAILLISWVIMKISDD